MEHIGSVLLGLSDQLGEKIDTLKRKLRVLETKEDDIKEELKLVDYSFSTKKPRKEVQNWLTEVGRMRTEVQKKEQEVQERRSWYRNPQLHKSVDKLTTEVAELIEQSKFPRGLTLETYERGGLPFPTKILTGEKFEENKKIILDCLMAGKDSIIGICGMGGVGKTTLLTHVHNELLKRYIRVSWVTVSRDFSIRKLQHNIAKILCLDITKEDDERKRAAQLALAFQSQKNFILILDDVWDNISPEKVGICVGEDGRKLILTTRSLEVCQMINCDKIMKMEPLSKIEAWALFVKTLGNETLLSGRIKSIAKSLVDECDGLPLGIIVMAGSMRGLADIHEWSNTLEEIKEAKYRNDDMEFYDVFCILKHSYDRLKDPKVQLCLLYCSLFPEDTLIVRDQLIEYFIDEELIDGAIKGRQSKIHKGHTILNKLEKVCLLEAQGDKDGQKCVKMHDLIRDMAIKIARTSHGFLVQAGMQLRDIPNDKEWSEGLVRVSLMSNHIQSIPFDSSSPKCPKLLTLLLGNNYHMNVIPELFFMHMKSLTVLDLSYTGIEGLPSSISNLENLTALLLERCGELRYVPSLENLTALRRLDLGWTAIEEVTEDWGKLINLRYLSLECCPELEMIPDGILSQFSGMEYFKSSEKVTLRGKEIGGWKKLETFFGRFDDVSEFNSCIRLWEDREPKEYTIHVGNEYYGDDNIDAPTFHRNLILNKITVGAEETIFLPRGIQFVECHGITGSRHILVPRGGRVHHCGSIRHVIFSCYCIVLFSPCLESLNRQKMLTGIVERERSLSPSSVPPVNTCSSLKRLEISECDGLKRLFTPTLLSHLQSLESCVVWRCRQLVEIIGEASDEDENEEATTAVISMPPRFHTLFLEDLPELKSVCNSSIKLSDSLEEIRIFGCRRLMWITLLWEEPQPHPSLERICVEEDWWDSVEWKHLKTKDVLQPYVHFRKHCRMLSSKW